MVGKKKNFDTIKDQNLCKREFYFGRFYTTGSGSVWQNADPDPNQVRVQADPDLELCLQLIGGNV